MGLEAILFYSLGFVIVASALGTILSANPIYSALYLALTMVSLAFIFFMLNAPFIAGVQLIVYAGAVMVLFVMVLMLFDLKREVDAFARGRFTNFLKISSAGWLCGLIAGAIYMSTEMIESMSGARGTTFSTQQLANELFTRYLFAFEALGVLLLLIAIGVVALSRAKGGTHV